MLKKRAIKKIFITTLSAFILLVTYTISNINNNEEVLKTNLEVEYVTGLGTNNIYLIDDNNYLVKTKLLLDTNDKVEQIKLLLKNLIKSDNSKFPNNLSATIPSNTKVLSVIYDEEYVSIDLSNKVLKLSDEEKEKMVESIVYSVMDLGNIKGVIISINGVLLEGYDKVLDKNIGINKRYNIKSRNDINKVVIYYMEEINDDMYYVPVTRYLNDSRDKVKIIVEELSSSYIYETNLMSFLNSNAKLLDYKEQENVMTLEFNDAIFNDQSKIVEEVKYTLAYSIFENYDVNEVMINVNNKNIESISKKDLAKK